MVRVNGLVQTRVEDALRCIGLYNGGDAVRGRSRRYRRMMIDFKCQITAVPRQEGVERRFFHAGQQKREGNDNLSAAVRIASVKHAAVEPPQMLVWIAGRESSREVCMSIF